MSGRELFEAWHNKEYADKLEWCEIKQEYKDFIDEAMWQAWQASANREGYKLAPVEPTKDMLNSGYRVKHDKIIDLGSFYKVMVGGGD